MPRMSRYWFLRASANSALPCSRYRARLRFWYQSAKMRAAAHARWYEFLVASARAYNAKVISAPENDPTGYIREGRSMQSSSADRNAKISYPRCSTNFLPFLIPFLSRCVPARAYAYICVTHFIAPFHLSITLVAFCKITKFRKDLRKFRMWSP